MKFVLKKLHIQIKKWIHDSINALCWPFYYVNNNKLGDLKCSQLMRCIFYYASPILITNAKIEARKGLILYNNANGIIVLKKHVYGNHCTIVKIFCRSKQFIK
jgi:hypothetical protein